MKLLLILLIFITTTPSFSGEMSTIDLLVREAASESYGYIFYDEWQMSSQDSLPGCLLTVKASVDYLQGGFSVNVKAIYCINRNENNSYILEEVNN